MTPLIRRVPRRRLLAVSAVLALASGCAFFGSDPDASLKPVDRTCPAPVSSVALGRPGEGDGPAWFTTDGSPIYITQETATHGGLLDPEVGSTAASIGRPETPPAYSPGHSLTSDTVAKVVLRERVRNVFTVPPGRYWLVNSNSEAITIDACDPEAITAPEAASPEFISPTVPHT